MAAGKSTVGRELADRLGWPFHDLDTMVENRCLSIYGRGITSLIDIGEEALFRLQERRVVMDELLSLQNPAIVSLGGGTLHNHSLGDWLENQTMLIVLKVSWGTVEERIMQSNRPLKKSANRLYLERQDGFNKGFQLVVDSKDVIEVVDTLESWVRSHR